MLSEHVDRLQGLKGGRPIDGRDRFGPDLPISDVVAVQHLGNASRCLLCSRATRFPRSKEKTKRHHGLKRTLIANARFARSKSAFQCPRARQHRPPAQFVQPKRLSSIGDRFVRQVMLVPDRVENAATAGKTKTENPGKVPHRPCSLSRDGRSCPRSAWRSLPRA
jgi:hypothetical protein